MKLKQERQNINQTILSFTGKGNRNICGGSSWKEITVQRGFLCVFNLCLLFHLVATIGCLHVEGRERVREEIESKSHGQRQRAPGQNWRD